MLKGVTSVTPGYAGGAGAPTYEAVSSGTTGHAEVVEVQFDPSKITLDSLLTVFFATHDATQVNRQGNDIGTQYRSVIFYATPEQKAEADGFIKTLNDSSKDGAPIATTVEPLNKFYPAEPYHLDYYARNQNAGYCQVIIAPKLQKVQEKFAALLNTGTHG